MYDASQFPKVIDGINWGLRTFNNRAWAGAAQEKAEEPEVPQPIKPEKKKAVIFEAMPGEPLPEKCPDYRPLLQRDGLILWAWEISGDDIRIIWLTSNGAMRRYQATFDDEGDLATARPEERYDDDRWGHRKTPDFIIYAAPPGLTVNMRKAFIAKLKAAGVSVNFDYEFSLGKQKAAREAAVYDKIENRQNCLSTDEAEILEVYRQLSDEGKASVIKRIEALLNEQEMGYIE